MMRGISPRADVEMTEKTKFRGGHLGFLSGFSINFDHTWYTHIKFTSE